MTERIYTIPASQVVEGMLVSMIMPTAFRRSWFSVDRVRPGNKYTISFGGSKSASPWCYDLLPDDPIKVTLPGPSPQDTAENGGVCSCGAGAMGKHAKGCQAEDLRLWPVGATWDETEKCWRIGDTGFTVYGLLNQFHERLGNGEYAAAFCEPEVQPCPDCCGKGFVPTWVEDDQCVDGGYEGPQERYCSCKAGQILRDRE